MERLYINIKNRREELGMSQEELAKKLGYKSRSSINKIEMGINDLPQSKIKDFAVALDTTVGKLMGWDEVSSADSATGTDSVSIKKINQPLSIEERADQILSGILDSEGDTLMLDGQPTSQEAVEALRNAIIMGITYAREIDKKKGNEDESDNADRTNSTGKRD